MRILQALPALYSGGVERGTVEFAADLVKRGHESFVVSKGGPMAEQLRGQGSKHIFMPIHRKNPASFGQILPMRKLLLELKPDIVHVRSRMPAWIIFLALKSIPKRERPAVVSTFHGMYSVTPYSAIMTRADHIIAVSQCVRDYVISNYHVPEEKLTVIQRGVDVDAFHQRELPQQWLDRWFRQYPQLAGKKIIMMPGRISRWKGQLDFLAMMAKLVQERPDCHGIIVGGAEPGKEHFLDELEKERSRLDLTEKVSFLGQRNDMTNLYLLSDVVCHMSTKPEPFGRTVTEALASGTPVVAYNRGGAAETLQACFREGLVAPDNVEEFAQAVSRMLDAGPPAIEIPYRFRHDKSKKILRLYNRKKAVIEPEKDSNNDRPQVKAGRVLDLKGDVLHRTLISLEQMERKYCQLSTEQARFIAAKGRRISSARLFAEFPLKFLKYYLLHRQILNGWFGLSVAITAANRNFMRLAKAREIQMLSKFERENTR